MDRHQQILSNQRQALAAAASKAAAAGNARTLAAARRLLDANANGVMFRLQPKGPKL